MDAKNGIILLMLALVAVLISVATVFLQIQPMQLRFISQNTTKGIRVQDDNFRTINTILNPEDESKAFHPDRIFTSSNNQTLSLAAETSSAIYIFKDVRKNAYTKVDKPVSTRDSAVAGSTFALLNDKLYRLRRFCHEQEYQKEVLEVWSEESGNAAWKVILEDPFKDVPFGYDISLLHLHPLQDTGSLLRVYSVEELIYPIEIIDGAAARIYKVHISRLFPDPTNPNEWLAQELVTDLQMMYQEVAVCQLDGMIKVYLFGEFEIKEVTLDISSPENTSVQQVPFPFGVARGSFYTSWYYFALGPGQGENTFDAELGHTGHIASTGRYLLFDTKDSLFHADPFADTFFWRIVLSDDSASSGFLDTGALLPRNPSRILSTCAVPS